MSNSGKTVDAFRTISEVAEELDLPQSVLRYWETRFGQIRPVKRAGGRRFYRPDDVDLLRGIRQLLYSDGYTINGVQKILKDQGIRFVQDVGVERTAAVMRSDVPPPPRLDPGPEAEDGTTFGGILGLLPRRRKAREDDALPALPQAVELPLPFPDADADRDLAAHAEDLPEPFAPHARPESRREPTLEARPPTGRPQPREGERLEPTLGPPPMQRPAQDVPPAAVFADPDDDGIGDEADFAAGPGAAFDDDPEPLPDPLRMRGAGGGAAPQPAAPRSADHDRPPPRLEAEPPRPAPSFAPRGPAPEPRVTMPLQRPSRGPAAHISHHGAAPELDDPLLPFMEPAGMTDDRPDFSAVSEPIEERIRRLKAQIPQPARPVYGRPAAGAAGPHPGAGDPYRAEAPPHWRGEDRSYFDPAPGSIAPDRGPLPQAPMAGANPQWGADPGPGAYPEEEPVFAPLSRPWQERPAAQERARPQAWPTPPRYAPAPAAPAAAGGHGGWATAPGAPPEAGLYGVPRGAAALSGAAPASPADFPAIVRRAASGGVAFEPPFAAGVPATHGHAEPIPPQPPLRMPPEPIRHGPPEQYLPPHLRGEPRLAGQPAMAAPAPVLSRDDIYRLQAALYELGECRRLMDEALGGGLEAAGEAGPG